MEISLNQAEIEKIVLQFYPKATSVVFTQDNKTLKAILTVDMENINSVAPITPNVKPIITPKVTKPLTQDEINEKERKSGVMASGGGRRTIVPM